MKLYISETRLYILDMDCKLTLLRWSETLLPHQEIQEGLETRDHELVTVCADIQTSAFPLAGLQTPCPKLPRGACRRVHHDQCLGGPSPVALSAHSEGPRPSPSVPPPKRSPPSPSTTLHLAQGKSYLPKTISEHSVSDSKLQIEHVFVYDGVVV